MRRLLSTHIVNGSANNIKEVNNNMIMQLSEQPCTEKTKKKKQSMEAEYAYIIM